MHSEALFTNLRGHVSGNAPTLVLMHFLGGSGREWDEVIELMGSEYRTLTVDMPGFGGSAHVPGYTVTEMADAVQRTVKEADLERYVLVGHSMSGKVAMVIARREQDAGNKSLQGLVLVAPSPPSPEPMGEEKRSMMLGLLGERHEDDAKRARNYITKNELRDIPQAVEQRASAEVLRMNRSAWTAWVARGSKEDWSERVGVVGLPALLIAGDEDLSLGPKQQRETTFQHLGQGQLMTVKGCSHLIPMERPDEMAAILQKFVEGLAAQALMTEVPPEYMHFIESERVAANTRQLLELRMAGPDRPASLFTAEQERTLRAVMARVVPDSGIDIAGYVMERLATGKGDGWRYDVLPTDAQAYRDGLDKLAADKFAELDTNAQDKALTALAAHKGSAEARWFEELRGDASTAYVAHPATLARLGYSGIGVGGAFTPYRGFVDLGLNSRESWEPAPTEENAK